MSIMKKRLLVLTIVGSVMLCFAGCHGKEPASTEATNGGNQSQDSVQAEVDAVEAAYQEILDNDSSSYTQMEMNMESYEMYELWDNELNALWEQIKATLDDSAYASLLDEQRAWIARKELHVRAYGAEAGGGSLQPCLENLAAADITRVRCYELGKVLADAKGEQFPTDVVEAYKDYYDPSYDDVMWGFRGPYDLTSYDGSTGELMISHETDEWEAIITYNGERKDVEVWGYNIERIIWKSTDGDYFEVGLSWEGQLQFVCRDDMKAFNDASN